MAHNPLSIVIHRHDARRYPAFRSQSLNVSKHVAVLSELARLVDVYHLLDVSQFEQELACADEHGLHYRELMKKLSSSRCQQVIQLDSCCRRFEVELLPAGGLTIAGGFSCGSWNVFFSVLSCFLAKEEVWKKNVPRHLDLNYSYLFIFAPKIG